MAPEQLIGIKSQKIAKRTLKSMAGLQIAFDFWGLSNMRFKSSRNKTNPDNV
jgi:hypothetical protein